MFNTYADFAADRQFIVADELESLMEALQEEADRDEMEPTFPTEEDILEMARYCGKE